MIWDFLGRRPLSVRIPDSGPCGFDKGQSLVLEFKSQSETSLTKSQLECEFEATALDRCHHYVDDIAIITGCNLQLNS